MFHWIAQHSGGWQVLVPAVVIFCIIGVRFERYQPLTFAAVWLAGITGMYVMAGIGAMMARDPRYWAALVAMAAIGVAIPLAAAYASAGLLRRAQPGVRWAWPPSLDSSACPSRPSSRPASEIG